MKREEGAHTVSGGTGLWTAGIVIAGVFAASVYITLSPGTGPDGEDAGGRVAPDVSAPLPDPAPGAEIVASEPDVTPEIAPSIDEVRQEADGLTVIAGRAAPGAEVSVLVDGKEIATAVADGRGDFAAVGVVVPGDAARVLTLEATGAGEAITSDGDVILAPVPAQTATATPETVQQQEPETAEALAETGDTAEAPAPAATTAPIREAQADRDPVAGQLVAPGQDDVAGLAAAEQESTAPVISEPQADTAIAAADRAPAAPPRAQEGAPAQSVTVLKSTAEGVELLQSDPPKVASVAIDTIGYSDAGDVQLSGRAIAGTSEVRVYLDNRFTTSLPVGSDGTWRGTVPQVAEGIYQLRVDAVNVAGVVTSRIETPFKREAPEVLAAAIEGQTGPVQAVTVQTGDTLWAIARERYGEGVLYVRVFDANRTDIRDPDLIYPGQVFDLPIE